jgi:hypothetical protein
MNSEAEWHQISLRCRFDHTASFSHVNTNHVFVRILA